MIQQDQARQLGAEIKQWLTTSMWPNPSVRAQHKAVDALVSLASQPTEAPKATPGFDPFKRARTLLSYLWRKYDAAGTSMSRSHEAVLLETAMDLLGPPDDLELQNEYGAQVDEARSFLSSRRAAALGFKVEGADVPATPTEAPIPPGYVKADQAMYVQDVYAQLCDIWAEANAVDTVIGRPVELMVKITSLRNAIGNAIGYIPFAPTEAQAVPAGWKLVPIEPTPEMMDHYRTAFTSEKRFDGAEVYKAMVLAAPPVQQPAELQRKLTPREQEVFSKALMASVKVIEPVQQPDDVRDAP